MTLIYGLFSIFGGITGYRKAGSKVSLISGVISGVLLLVGAFLLGDANPVGGLIAFIVSLVLVIVFAIRLAKTRKFMPAGLMVILGVINVALLLPFLRG